MSTEECKLERADPLHTHTPLPSNSTHTLSDSHTHTPRHFLSPQQLWGKGSLTLCCVCMCVCACYVETRTEQEAELRLCDQIWNGRESHSSSCSLALRGSHSDRGQSQGHRHRGLPLLPLNFASSAHCYWLICIVKRITLDWVLCICVPRPVWSEDEDEGAVSASGPWPKEGVGSAGTWLWLCSALSIQEEAQSLPARTGRCLYEYTYYRSGLTGLLANGLVY